MKKTFLISFLLVVWVGVNAQKIENVTATQQGKNIVVSYDLTGSSGSEFDVALYCSTDGGSTFGSPLYSVTGDVGNSIKTGNSKQITWNVLTEREKLAGNRIVFEVRANAINKNVNDLGIEMVFVKGGTFTMGCTSEQSDCQDDEKPTHQVTVSDFYIGKYEVTQKQWRDIMGASNSLSDPSYFKNCDNCPVEQVSWNDVQEFIKKLNQKTGKNYRLPAEAEWEYAARGGVETLHATSQHYAGSNNIDEVAWYTSNSGSKTHPVGQKKPNALGIYDMSGNVWEWCSDWYGNYSSASQTNPQGPSSGSGRVGRGGSCFNNPQYCRVASRHNGSPDVRNNFVGFRLSRMP